MYAHSHVLYWDEELPRALVETAIWFRSRRMCHGILVSSSRVVNHLGVREVVVLVASDTSRPVDYRASFVAAII